MSKGLCNTCVHLKVCRYISETTAQLSGKVLRVVFTQCEDYLQQQEATAKPERKEN